MNNPFSTFQGFASRLQQFAGNPMQYMMQTKLNIPQQYMQSPDSVIQYLMNTGKVDQNTYNQLNQVANQIQATPMFKQFIGRQ